MATINLRQHSNFITKIYHKDIADLKDEGVPRVRLQPVAWPSEALAQLGSMAVGECKRAMFYKVLGSAATEPMSMHGRGICDAGNLYESYNIDKFKKSGMFVSEQNKIEFAIPDSKNSVFVTGRMDVIIETDGVKKSIELKSVSAYKAPKVMGDSKTLPLPAVNNLMQSILYNYYLNNIPAGQALGVQETYLMYINRNDGSVFYYRVMLDDQGYPIISAIDHTGTEIYELKLNSQQSFDQLLQQAGNITGDEARIAELRVNVKDIFSKFDLVYDYTNNKMLPPQDYSIIYNSNEIEREYKLGRISKIKYNKSQKGEALGDGKCSYCSYRTKCMADSGITL
jgi:hypothetical protein